VWNLDHGSRSIRAGIRLLIAGVLLLVSGVAVIAPSFSRRFEPDYPISAYKTRSVR
jgi:hypothetical protein